MISTFARNGYLVQSFSTNHFDSGKKHESLRNKMKKEVKKLLEKSPAAIIMDGYCNGQIPLKKEIMKLNTENKDIFAFSIVWQQSEAFILSSMARPNGIRSKQSNIAET